MEAEHDPEIGPAPARFVPRLLADTADVYRVLCERGLIASDVAERIEGDLTVLSMSYRASAA